jgi:hypothetical protein
LSLKPKSASAASLAASARESSAAAPGPKAQSVRSSKKTTTPTRATARTLEVQTAMIAASKSGEKGQPCMMPWRATSHASETQPLAAKTRLRRA